MKDFIFGTFKYEYYLMKQDRKTMSLTVTPDLRIILKCPFQTDSERIEVFLQKKWFWLERQLSFFKKYQRRIYEKEYVSGEGCVYLGRQYKLVIKKDGGDTVSLSKGQLVVQTNRAISNTRHNKKLVDTWFANKANYIFQTRLDEMLSKFDYKNTPRLAIRDMKKRWGSFLNQDIIFLNPKLIHVPKECVDYVIVHELCHMKYKKHNKRFYELLDEKYPKWQRIKERLELAGSMF
jgi:predicted metal-dependent hydrolase